MRMMLPLEPCQGTQWSGSVGDELVGNLVCKMGVLEAWHQIDTSVKQAEQASHSKQLFHVSDCPWCSHFRILSTPMNPFGADIATGVPGVRHMALH